LSKLTRTEMSWNFPQMEKGTKNNEFVRKIREILISDQK